VNEARRQPLRNRIRAAIPVVLFAAFMASAIALVATAQNASLPVTIACAVGLTGAIGGLVGWVLITDRRAAAHDVPRQEGWQDFERAFWAHVDELSDTTPERD
jgi:hypothetical protein